MSDEATVIPLTPQRMSDADYDRERQRIRDLFGDSKAEAAARWEQELASLFWRSGWTQEELAAKEGKSQTWVQFRLRFGRFLAFSENSTTGTIVTERRFRQYWEKTEGSNERQRFRLVTEMIELDAKHRAGHSTFNPIGEAIREKYMDGKWHAPEAMAKNLACDISDLNTTLGHMLGRASNKYKAERRRHGPGWQYRIFPTEKTVSSVELTEKLRPLIDDLRAEGRKNMATIAISRIAMIAAELQQLLSEWTR